MEAGEPASYLTLEPGAEVISSDGENVGRVEHVLREPDADIFDGIVIDTRTRPGGLRFVDASHVAEIHQGSVILAVASGDVAALPNPEPNPATVEHHGIEDSERELRRKLDRAWDMISGRG